MKGGLRVWLAIFALALALALVWRKVRIVFVVQLGWLQLILMILFVALVIYLLLDLILRRLGR